MHSSQTWGNKGIAQKQNTNAGNNIMKLAFTLHLGCERTIGGQLT